MTGLRRDMARLVLRRGLTGMLIFGAFGLTALAWPTVAERLAGVALAFVAFAFSRDRPSRILGILIFVAGSQTRFEIGLGALLLAWAMRSALSDRKRRRRALTTLSHSEISASPQALSVDEEVAHLQRDFGDRWMLEGLSGNLEVRSRAAAAMAGVPLDAIPEVIQRLEYLGDSTAAFALIDRLNTLEKFHRERGLVAFTLGHHGLSIRTLAIESLARGIDGDSAPVLIAGLARTVPPDPDLVGLLSRLGPGGVAPLLEGVRHPHRHARASCIEALGAMKCESARGAIVECLRAREPIVRIAAATALGAMGSTEAASALLASLRDKSWEVREASALALGRLKAVAAADELKRLLEDPHSEVSTAAATVLKAVEPVDDE